MKSKNMILILAIAALIGFTLAIMTYAFYYIEGVQKYNMTIIVGDHIGFDTDNELIAFGMVMPGAASSTRFIFLTNKKDYPIKAEFRVKGQIADWVSINHKEFILEPLENETIPVSATAPTDSEFGNYTGELTIVFKKALFE